MIPGCYGIGNETVRKKVNTRERNKAPAYSLGMLTASTTSIKHTDERVYLRVGHPIAGEVYQLPEPTRIKDRDLLAEIYAEQDLRYIPMDLFLQSIIATIH